MPDTPLYRFVCQVGRNSLIRTLDGASIPARDPSSGTPARSPTTTRTTASSPPQGYLPGGLDLFKSCNLHFCIKLGLNKQNKIQGANLAPTSPCLHSLLRESNQEVVTRYGVQCDRTACTGVCTTKPCRKP